MRDWVAEGRIDGNGVRAEQRARRREDRVHQRGTVGVGRQIDPPRRLSTVAAHHGDTGLRPPQFRRYALDEVVAHRECRGKFVVRGGDAALPDGIAVDGQVRQVRNVRVAGRVLGLALEVIVGPRQQVGIDRVLRDVDAFHGVTYDRLQRCRQRVGVVEVAGERRRLAVAIGRDVSQDAHLPHLVGTLQDQEMLPHLVEVREELVRWDGGRCRAHERTRSRGAA